MLVDFNPFALQFTEDFGIRWYGLSLLFTLFFSWGLVRWLSRRQQMGLVGPMILDFLLTGSLGLLIGGRLGYCLFYAPDLFLKFKMEVPFWAVLAINEGGLSSHGAMLGLAVSLIIFAWRSGVSQPYLLDLSALVGAFGIFVGRVVNFISGEAVGRATDVAFPFTVKFPQDILFWTQTEPSSLSKLQAVAAKVPEIDAVKFADDVQNFAKQPSIAEHLQDSLQQIVTAVQSGNTAAKEALTPLLTARYPVQLYAAFGEGLALFVLLFIMWYRPRKSGVISALFLTIYSMVRIFDERFRQPDWNIGYQWFDMTRGQMLSVVGLIIGFWLLVFYGRREAIAQPGWGLGPNVRIHRR